MKPKRQPTQISPVFDFPEDGFINGPENQAEEALMDSLMQFGRPRITKSLDDPDMAFCQGYRAAVRKGGEGIAKNLWIDLLDWLLFDHAFENDRRTIADLYMFRKKYFLPGLQKIVLAMMCKAEMDLFEIRAVYPGRGFTLKRLEDGSEFQVVDMIASRQLPRWGILACRLWLLDGVHRLSGATYIFTPDKRPLLEKTARKLAKANAKDGRVWRERFSPQICQLWIDPLIHPVQPRFRNRDGDRLNFCRAVFRLADREVVRKTLLEQHELTIREENDNTLTWNSLERDGSGGQTIMGTFRLLDGELHFEANSRKRFQRGMKVLKETLGDALRLQEEERIPLKEMLKRKPQVPPEPVNIPKEVQEEIILDFKRKHMENWPGMCLPALDGKTPRQAVRSHAGRKAVAQLLKDFEVHEQKARLRGEPALDLVFLWRELGLKPEDY
jgi:hypothetical protein